MATRTSTTRTMSSRCEPSADTNAGTRLAPFPFSDLVQAYFDCRKSKRNSRTALLFEQNLERNLIQIYNELINEKYQIGRSICFVITHPKPREVWAAEFRDRIVHHLLYNHIAPTIEARFAAQGFPADYIIDHDAQGNPIPKYKQVARCGNSVCPDVAAAIVSANYQSHFIRKVA